MEEPTTVPTRPVKKERPQASNKATAIVLLVILAPIVWFIVNKVNAPKAKYEVSDTQVTFVSDTTVSVSFKVKNIGKASGQPICQIDAHSDDHTYYGGDMPRLSQTLKPNETTTTAGPITINKNGAANVTTADVSCS